MEISIKKLNNIFLPIIFIIALILRVAYVTSLEDNKLGGDAVGYDKIAWNLSQGFGFVEEKSNPTAFVFPGYPLFLSFIYSIFGHSLISVRIVQSLLSAFICILIYFITKIIFKREDIAKLSSAISVFYPSLIIYCGEILNDLLVTFFLSISIYFLLRAIDIKRNIYYILTGIFVGFLILTRGEYLLVLFFILIWFIILRLNFKELISKYILILFITILILTPWLLRNYIVFKKFPLLSTRAGITLYNSYFLSDKGFSFNQLKNIDKEYFLLKTEVEKDKYLMNKGLNFIKENPLTFLKLIPVKIGMILYPFDGKWHRLNLFSKYNLIYGLIFCFGVLGILFSLREKERKSYLLILLIFQIVIIYSIFYGKPQYRFSIEPSLIIFSSVGFFNIKERYNKKISFLIIGTIITINLVLFFCSDYITLGLRELMNLITNNLPRG